MRASEGEAWRSGDAVTHQMASQTTATCLMPSSIAAELRPDMDPEEAAAIYAGGGSGQTVTAGCARLTNCSCCSTATASLRLSLVQSGSCLGHARDASKCTGNYPSQALFVYAAMQGSTSRWMWTRCSRLQPLQSMQWRCTVPPCSRAGPACGLGCRGGASPGQLIISQLAGLHCALSLGTCFRQTSTCPMLHQSAVRLVAWHPTHDTLVSLLCTIV